MIRYEGEIMVETNEKKGLLGYGTKDLYEIASKAYVAATGQVPSADIQTRMNSGIDAFLLVAKYDPDLAHGLIHSAVKLLPSPLSEQDGLLSLVRNAFPSRYTTGEHHGANGVHHIKSKEYIVDDRHDGGQ